MTFDWPVVAFVIGGAIAWGDLRSQVSANRKTADERHLENVGRLQRIEAKVDQINGTVHEHGARIDGLEDNAR